MTDENDPFFFYFMEVGETEFHGLKQEQQLLVDFSTFPSKLVELMELCVRKTEETPKFITSLMSTSMQKETCDAVLSIIETNQFKHLTHLSLKFKCGNDEMIKRYLAGKLKEFKQDNDDLIQRLKSKEDLLAVKTQELDSLQIQAGKLLESKEQTIELFRMEEQRKLTELKEKMLDSQTSQTREIEKEKRAMQENLEMRVRELQNKVEYLSQQTQELSQKKAELEHSERSLKTQNSSQAHELEMLNNELQNLRKNNKSLDSHKYTQEKSLTEFQLKNEALKRTIEDKEEQIQNLNDLVLSNQQSKAQLEETLGMYKASCKKLEDKFSLSTQEIAKGNQIISQLQSQIKDFKQKIKIKNSVVIKQENLIQQKQDEIDSINKAISQFKREANTKDFTIKELEHNLEDFKNKLQQSQTLVAENENSKYLCLVIKWLNTQLSEAQKAGGIAKYANQGAYKSSNIGLNTGKAQTFQPSIYSIEQLRLGNQPGNLIGKNYTTLPSQPSSTINYQQQIQNSLERNQQTAYTPSLYMQANTQQLQSQNSSLMQTPVRQNLISQQTSIVQSEQSQYGDLPPLDLIVPIKYKEPNK